MEKTPLHAWHESHHATMTEFAGWDMPLYYTSMTDEHLHTRRAAGLFDISHMGRIMVTGADARAFVDKLTPVARDAEVGQVHYSFLLNERGCPVDDITIYLGDSWIMLVVNGGSRPRVLEWLKKQSHRWQHLRIEDKTYDLAMFALQGPRSDEVMNHLFSGSFQPLPYYHYAQLHTPNLPYDVMISATGYTGEAGYELYLPAEHSAGLWSMVIALGGSDVLRPIGLGARDSLRLEAAMPLYGHELTEETTPFAAGMGKFVDLEKTGFIGREALLSEKQIDGLREKLVCFEMTGRGPTPRHACTVKAADGRDIGRVTSGVFSPTLQKNIGMAYVESGSATVGTQIQIEIRERLQPAQIVKRPFYKRSK